MRRISFRIKNIMAVSALAVILILPSTTNAELNQKGWFFNIKREWNLFQKRCQKIIISWTTTKPRTVCVECVPVPEFSTDAASGSIALLIGGSLILMGRRRKEHI